MTPESASTLFPLLHAGQTALRVTTLDLRLTALAALIFVAAALWIWRPAASGAAFLPARQRRSLARAALTGLIFLAVLPSVFPYDHLLPGAHDDDGQEAVHVSHCHVSPGTCSDAPVTAGPGQLLHSQPLLLTPALLAIAMIAAVPVLTGLVLKPEVRPPLRALNS